MWHFGVNAAVALQNDLAWMLALLCRKPIVAKLVALPPGASPLFFVLTIGFLCMSLFGPDLHGVHRWLKIGMLLQCAPVVLPIIIIALGSIQSANAN